MSTVHLCRYKKSIREAGFSRGEESAIWDFYVTRSIAQSASQRRRLMDYRPPSFGKANIKLEQLAKIAGIEQNLCISMCNNNMTGVLMKLGLFDDKFDLESIDIPRLAILTPTRYNEERTHQSVTSLMSHLRNALAHGRTFFFENGFTLLEDALVDGTVTARILIRKQTLLDWILYFDIDRRFYPLF